ncbi:GNAT family N-acetyltransferase [Noviherbaspirillum sp.]|uniref:GNAT family N-acetyltransferase n=1 Tax=Noviherbaspirillum sp. TaxID=1926288 RepID=UPI002D571D14|nr:GNAT family N-acetyltransferase [Noviherbaspirillum sp.]HZW21921.1 GNAT family N-acetyltransferase [Noviherbaspirillum sp.]
MFNLLPIPLDWNLLQLFRAPSTREVHDTWRLKDGTPVILRVTRPEDGELIQELVRGLSEKTRYQRFFSPIHELSPRMLDRFTRNGGTEAMTLVAVVQQDGREVAIAMAQYVADPYPERCDFGVVVADDWQRSGLGRKLIESLICLARAAGFERIEGDVLVENVPIHRLMHALGFRFGPHPDGVYLSRVKKRLAAEPWKCTPLTALVRQPAQAKAMARCE